MNDLTFGITTPNPCNVSKGDTRMLDDTALTEAARAYATAYAAHYSDRDLATALGLYQRLVASHSRTPEAEYARTQLRNIVNAVVPKQALLDAQTELVLARLEGHVSPDTEPIPVTSLASERAE